MIIQIKNNWASAAIEHNAYLTKIIDELLDNSNPATKLEFTRQFVTIVKDSLLSDKIEAIKESITFYNFAKTLLTPKAFSTLTSDLKKIFKYSKFIAKTTKPWNAYSLCEKSTSRTCPYCNQAYSFTIKEKEKEKEKPKSLRPTLDHFFPKDKYPHLSLTLANLIPSCSTCNSTLKGKTDFSSTPHLHPLYDDENIIFLCDTEKHTILDIRSNYESIRHELNILVKPKIKCKKTNNSLKTFAVVSRYKKVRAEALEFISAKSTIPRLLGERLIDLDARNLESKLLRFNP